MLFSEHFRALTLQFSSSDPANPASHHHRSDLCRFQPILCQITDVCVCGGSFENWTQSCDLDHNSCHWWCDINLPGCSAQHPCKGARLSSSQNTDHSSLCPLLHRTVLQVQSGLANVGFPISNMVVLQRNC